MTTHFGNDAVNVLAIGAHPDDIELGCGATLWLCRKSGARLFGLIITDGSFAPTGQEPRKVDVRRLEAINGAAALEMSIAFGDVKDRHASCDIVRRLVLRELAKRPTHVILCHVAGHRHDDHDAVANGVTAAMQSTRCTALHLGFEVPLHRYAFSSNSVPNCFIAVDAGWERKLFAIRKHQSEIRRQSISIHEVHEIGSARATALQNIQECAHAEAFVLHNRELASPALLEFRRLLGDALQLSGQSTR